MTSANYLRETIDLVKQIETRFLELGSRLYKIQKDGLWEGEYDSFMEFVDATGVTRTAASKLTTIHKTYIVEHGVSVRKLAEVGYSKLYDAIPLLGKGNVESVVMKAKLLSQSELHEEVREERHGECKHLEQITICAGCHKRIYEEKKTN